MAISEEMALTGDLVARPILFIYRMSDPNLGDRLSSPFLYFHKSYPGSFRREIELPQEGMGARIKRRILRGIRDTAGLIVIGGGGLIDIEYFRKDMAFWTSGPAPAVLWGAGHNAHDPQAVAQAFPDQTRYDQLVPFSAIGLRDWGPGFNWVPCASCMNPIFDATPPLGRGTLFIMHRQLRDHPEMIRNLLTRKAGNHEVVYNDASSEELFGKLSSAREVVTTSFHGAYWASLWKKPVVAVGGGTKVGMLKHAVAISTVDDWPAALQAAPIHSNALEECRERNIAFNNHIIRQFVRKPTAGRAKPQNPVAERQADFAAFGIQPPVATPGRTPRTIHFIFGLSPDFGGKPFNIMHYIAVRSVAAKFNPDEILFHHQFEPDNEFYLKVKHLLTPVSVTSPEYHKGQYIEHFAHRADVIRLRALNEIGGIYLDLDTITVASLEPLLAHSFTIGLQGRRPTQGLCNAAIAAAPGDPFVADWLSRYDNFDAAEWDRFSVKLPYLMWRSGKYSVNIEPHDRFHWPLWDEQGLKMMFEQSHRFENALLHHLWESRSYPRYFAKESFSDAVKRVKAMRSTYGALASPYL